MKPEKLFVVLFVCMGVLLAVMYGVFELGGWEMGMCEKVFKIIAIGLVVVAIIIVAVFACIAIGSASVSGERNSVYFCDTELAKDASNLFIMRERTVLIPQGIDAIIYTGDECLKESNLEKNTALKCLYFAGNGHTIEKDLYKTLLENDVNITVCNGDGLTIVDKDGAAVSSVSVAHKTEPKEQQNCAITGKIDLSVQTKQVRNK